MANPIYSNSEFLFNIENLNELDHYANDLFNRASQAINTARTDEMWSKLNEIYNSLDDIEDEIDLETDSNNKRSYYFGVIKSIVEIIKLNSEYLNEQEYFKKVIKSSNHIVPFINYLAEKRCATHGEICSALGITPNVLSNFIKKSSSYSFFRVQRSGKYKIYFITSRGLAIKKYILKYSAATKNDGNTTIQLIRLLNDELDHDAPSAENMLSEWDGLNNFPDNQKGELLNEIKAVIKKKSGMYIDNNNVIPFAVTNQIIKNSINRLNYLESFSNTAVREYPEQQPLLSSNGIFSFDRDNQTMNYVEKSYQQEIDGNYSKQNFYCKKLSYNIRKDWATCEVTTIQTLTKKIYINNDRINNRSNFNRNY